MQFVQVELLTIVITSTNPSGIELFSTQIQEWWTKSNWFHRWKTIEMWNIVIMPDYYFICIETIPRTQEYGQNLVCHRTTFP